jgi:hypothetical protein
MVILQKQNTIPEIQERNLVCTQFAKFYRAIYVESDLEYNS